MARKSNQPLIIGLIVGGAALAVGIIGVCIVAFATSTPSRKTYTREEFTAAVVGKTESQVIANVGRPWQAYDRGNGRKEWVYFDQVLNPATRKYGLATLYFADGVVERVKF